MPDYELFIIAKGASRLPAGLKATLEPIVACLGDIPILGASVRRDDDADVALIGIRLAIEVLPGRMRQQLLHSVTTEIQLLETARLPPQERQRFFDVHLSRYRTILAGVPTIEEALCAFDADRRAAKPSERPAAAKPPSSPSAAVRATAGRARRGGGPLELFFEHDGEWYRTRIVSVGAEHVTAITSVPPLCGLVIELGFSRGGGEREMLVRAKVTKSSLWASPADGQLPAFSARLLPESDDHAREIRSYLTEAMHAAAPEKPPPLRRDARIPYQGPATLARGGRRLACAVVDVSRRGMFVATRGEELSERAIDKQVEVEMRLPGEDGPVRFGARVARVIPHAVTKARGLPPGVGLELVDTDSPGLARFQSFVDRLAAQTKAKLSRDDG